jgi:hypothetical protein
MKYLIGVPLILAIWWFGFRETPEEERGKIIASLNQKIIFEEHSSEEERKIILNTLNYLISNGCKKLLMYTSSIENMEVSYSQGSNVLDWAKNRYGWSSYVEFKPKIKDKPQVGISDAAGHTLYFYAGVGMLSGIYARKDEGREICSLPATRFILDEQLREAERTPQS